MRFRIGPILRDAAPLRAQPFLVGIGILNDESSQALRMRRDDAEPDRPTIVVKVEGVSLDLELLEKAVDRPRQVIKGVRIERCWRGVAMAEAWEVRCDHMISCSKQRNERI